MKIAMVGPASVSRLEFIGGASLPKSHQFGMNADLINGLVKAGHELHVFTGGDVIQPVTETFAPHSVTIVPRRGGSSAVRLYQPTIRGLANSLNRFAPYDIVHGHWLYDYACAALKHDKRAIITIHDWPLGILKLSPSLPSFIKYFISKRVASQLIHATAPSPYMCEISERRLGIKPTRLISNGFPDELFSVSPREASAHARLIAVNNGFDKRKNVQTLLEAFSIFRRNHKDASLRLFGVGFQYGGQAHAFARANGLSSGVAFEGPQDRSTILEAMRGASLFVHPSLEESFGLVVIEAMSQRLPVLAGINSGAVPSLLDHGRVGFLADVRSPEPLAEAIKAALSCQNTLTNLSEKAFDFAVRNYTASTMIASYESTYRELLSKA